MKNGMDIHNLARRLQCAKLNYMKKLSITKNKETVREFVEHITITNTSNSRITRYIDVLIDFEKCVKKNFEDVDCKDVKKYVVYLQENNYSAWTIYTQQSMIKRFYKWLKGKDEFYPDEVKWLHPKVKETQMKPFGEGDLLTEKDVQLMTDAAENPRDRAFISLLFESGCRIGEIGTLQIKNVKIDNNGVILTVQGKTGIRPVRVISSTPHVMTWLQCHPDKENPDAPLWAGMGQTNRGNMLKYGAFKRIIRNMAAKANVKKRCNPHLFRHSRATQLANHLTELQMDKYFGWTFGSKMPCTYVHMSGRDLDASIFELNGIRPEEKANTPEIQPKLCPRCSTINTYDAKFCKTCAGALDAQTAMELNEKSKSMQEMNEMMNSLSKNPALMEKFVSMMQQLSKA